MAKVLVEKIFKVGSLANYQALTTKDANTLYFIKDKKMAFRGGTRLLGNFEVVANTTAATEQGVIYYIPASGTKGAEGYVAAQLGYYDGTNFQSILGDATIDALEARVTAVEKKSTVKTGDKILSQDADGISSKMSIKYVSADKKIYLYGSAEDDAHKIGEINATDFIKDGMLDKAEFKTEGTDHAAADGPYIVLTWNTDSGKTDPMWISVKGLVDVYTGTTDEIVVENNIISLAQAVKDAIAAALTSISVSTTKTDDYVTLDIPAKATGATTQEVGVQVTYGKFTEYNEDGTVKTAAVNGITKVQDVEKVITDNEKVTAAALNDINDRIGGEKDAQGNITGLETTAKNTLVNAINEVNAAVTSKNVSAEGETGDAALVTASATNNKVTVGSSQKLKSAVAAAETAVQTVSEATTGQEVTVAQNGTAVTVGVSKATYAAAAEGAAKTLSTTGLVDGQVLTDYVADNALYWEEF